MILIISRELAGAQRLSASLESSLERGDWKIRHRGVLNAFRHHWNLHSAKPNLKYTKGLRCAQRLSASLESSPPRGLRGRNGLGSRVLNAFRHHWNLHCRKGH